MIISRIEPYFNLEDKSYKPLTKYKYKRKNGRKLKPHSQFNFKTFLKCKDGSIISFRKNINYKGDENQPLFYMFVDINGEEKPNKIGEDIFFIDIFEHEIKALGYDKEYSNLKQNCSPLGSGLYCSEFYLLGGHF